MGTSWDARTYDRSSEPQQAWGSEVLARFEGIAPDATVLDVGCGTGRVTEALLALVPEGRVLAIDASIDMVSLAYSRLGDRAAEVAGVGRVATSRSSLSKPGTHRRLIETPTPAQKQERARRTT